MNYLFFSFWVLLLMEGVFGDEVKSVSVKEGDSVTLHTDITELQREDQILWLFGPHGTRIARVYKQYDVCDPCGSFKNRMKLDSQTGSLTITNITIKDSGHYHLQIINSRGASYNIFNVTVYGVFGVDGDEVKSVSVKEGDSVTLHTDITDIQRDQQILWRFGPHGTRIAQIYKQYDVCDPCESFKDRLKLDSQTGSLTITNITITNSGLYQLEIIKSKGTSYKRFNVTVYARLPIPVITCINSPFSSSSSSSKCVLLCSVLMRDVSLSWYKGNSLLFSISVSDLNIRLSLPLEVEYQDTNTYRCVLNNTITNQTLHLNIKDVCQMCSGSQETSSSCLYWIPALVAVILFLVAVAVVAAAAAVKYYKRYKQTLQDNQEAEVSPMNHINNYKEPDNGLMDVRLAAAGGCSEDRSDERYFTSDISQ